MARQRERQDQSRTALTELLTFAVGDAAGDLAGKLLRRYSSIGAILHLAANCAVPGLEADPAALRLLKTTRRVLLSSLWAEAAQAPFAHGHAVVDYLKATMAHATHETTRALFVGPRYQLVADEQVSAGAPLNVALPIRPILRRAIELEATGLILAHNHPSGDPTPSRQDRMATARLEKAAALLGITLHDHLIFASTGWTSLQALGLLRGPG